MPKASRFAVEKGSYYRPSDLRVKPKAFLPQHGATSVFCFPEGFQHGDMIEHGNAHVGAPRGKEVVGYASVPVASIEREGLSLLRSEPPPLHCNIEGWPEDEDACKTRALALAEDAVFTLA